MSQHKRGLWWWIKQDICWLMICCLVLAILLGAASLTDYKGRSVISGTPSGPGGVATKDNTVLTADRTGIYLEVAGVPDTDDDDQDTGGNGKVYEMSIWKDTNTSYTYRCLDASVGAAEWVRLVTSTAAGEIGLGSENVTTTGAGRFDGGISVGNTPIADTILIETSDTDDPTITFKTTNTAHEIDVYLDENETGEDLVIASNGNTDLTILSDTGASAGVHLKSNKSATVTASWDQEPGGLFDIINNVEDADLEFVWNQGGSLKKFMIDGATGKYSTTDGTFDFTSDHIATLGNISSGGSGSGIQLYVRKDATTGSAPLELMRLEVEDAGVDLDTGMGSKISFYQPHGTASFEGAFIQTRKADNVEFSEGTHLAFGTTKNAGTVREVAYFNPDGELNIGVVTNEIAPLTIQSNANHWGISIEENSGGELWSIGVDAVGNLNFLDSGGAVPDLTIVDGSGNVETPNSFQATNVTATNTIWTVTLYQDADNATHYFGQNDDASIVFDGDSLNITGNLVTASDAINLVGNVGIAQAAPDGLLHIGPTATLSTNPTVVIAVAHTGNANFRGVVVESTMTPTTNTHAYAAYDTKASLNGSADFGHINAFQSNLRMEGSGTVDRMASVRSVNAVNAGTVTALRHIDIVDFTGAGTVTTQYGLYIPGDFDNAGTNWAIYSADADAESYLAGNLGVGDVNPTQRIDTGAGDITMDNGQWYRMKIAGGADVGILQIDANDWTVINSMNGEEIRLSLGATDYKMTLIETGVGVLTTSPDAALQVVGDTKLGDDNTNYASVSATGTVSFTGSAGLILPSGTTPAPATEGALFLDTDASANGSIVCYSNSAWRVVVALP